MPALETYSDFNAYYSFWLSHSLQGYLPYRDFPYTYPPAFLYALLPFYFLGAAEVPIIVADALTAVVIYEISRRFVDEKKAMLCGFTYSFLPTALLYEGYVWMSSQPFIFFVLLSVLFLLERKDVYSGLSLGVAALFKQEALLMLPFVVLFYLLPRGRTLAMLKSLVTAVTALFTASIPFLVAAPAAYLSAVSLGLLGQGPSTFLATPATTPFIINRWTPTLINDTGTAVCSAVASITKVCSNNGLTYTEVFHPPDILALLGRQLSLPYALIVVVASVAVYISLRTPRAAILVSASIVNFLIYLLTYMWVLNPYRYYFLPVFAIAAIASDLAGAVALIGLSSITLLVEPGSIQPLILSTGLLFLLALPFLTNGGHDLQ
jgi:hypothetical protein